MIQSLSVSGLDIKFSMLFSSLCAIKIILLCFFLVFLLSLFFNFFFQQLLIENIKLRLALVIPIIPQITVADEAIETLPIVADKTSKILSK